ncbi:MAG: nicotinate (nicotinamide) nucleotide adenylyltransferase [Puniceicoccaceae bacterium]|nr:MAG: nicotinate (nicotinamide) nucleotide adenylyltransferase [Puniceicoccaceae bacterium]
MLKKPALILFGGSFDPIHSAHLGIAEQALRSVEGEGRVLFIPAAQSPLKAQAAAATAAQRLAMLRLAIEHEPRFTICDWELRRGGKSFSIDTVRHLASEYPEHEHYWLIGTDQLRQLPKWYAIEEIACLVTFLVYRREGTADVSIPEVADLRVAWVDGPLLPASSTAIRHDAQILNANVPKKVAAFIRQNGLYRPS